MLDPKDLSALSRDELLTLVAVLQAQVDSLQRQLAEASATIAVLRQEVADLTRSGKRQAAPFSKGTRVAHPKPPGRKPGQGPFTYRSAPAPEELTALPVDVAVREAACPMCGGELALERVDVVSVTDLPPQPQAVVAAYRVQVCRCRSCGRRVRGQHPDVAADQQGATAHRLGGRVLAAAHTLHYEVGVPVRKVPSVLQVLTGVEVTQGALTQDALRRAQGTVGQAYQDLRASVRASAVTHTDDTGWRVGGEPAHLMAFETDQATVYQVRARHRNEEVREVVPADYAGVLVTDRGRSYDARELADVRQQKCLAHVLRSLREVAETKRGPARGFTTQLTRLLREALDLGKKAPQMERAGFTAEAARLQAAITHQLRDRRLTDPDNQRLLNELGGHQGRGNLLRFLATPGVEPTNNRAERALRPAVIARKVSQCSKTWEGAEAFAAFTSVVRTLVRQGASPVDGLHQLFRPAPVQCSPP
jgi:transposase